MGIEYQRGTGAIRLIYCSITALTLSAIRIVCDLALGFALVHHSAWTFLIASLIDLLLAVSAGIGAYWALTLRRWGAIFFAKISYLETAIYSLAYFLVVILDTLWCLGGQGELGRRANGQWS